MTQDHSKDVHARVTPRISDHQVRSISMDINAPIGWDPAALEGRFNVRLSISLSKDKVIVEGHTLRLKPPRPAYLRGIHVDQAGRITGEHVQGKSEAFCSCSLAAVAFVETRAKAWEWWSAHLAQEGLTEAAEAARGGYVLAALEGEPEPPVDPPVFDLSRIQMSTNPTWTFVHAAVVADLNNQIANHLLRGLHTP